MAIFLFWLQMHLCATHQENVKASFCEDTQCFLHVSLPASFIELFVYQRPHIADKIFGLLDFNNKLKCRQVSKDWQMAIDLRSKLWPPSVKALHICARYDKVEEGTQLLDLGSRISPLCNRQPHPRFPPFLSVTPLNCAIFFSSNNMVRLLLSRGAASRRHCNVESSLTLCVQSCNHEALQAFIEIGIHPLNMLHVAAYEGCSQCLELVRPFASNLEDGEGHYGTALHAAVESGKPDNVRSLIRFGAHLNAQDCEAITPLIRSINNNSATMTVLLLTHGADVNFVCRGSDGCVFYPIHFAIKEMDKEG